MQKGRSRTRNRIYKRDWKEVGEGSIEIEGESVGVHSVGGSYEVLNI